jgi:GMP synthase-like glutamine amidotransferase
MKYQAIILQNAEGEGPGILGDFLTWRGWHQHIVHLYKGEQIPQEWEACSLLVVMGGPMNVHEEKVYPFLSEETILLKKAFKKEMPILGFCLGAQLMAKAMGSKVFKGPKKEIGWYRVHLTTTGKSDTLLNTFSEDITVFQWHGDTFELPKGGVRLFQSENYLNQGMRMGYLCYGFQFHFEITKEMIAEWLQTGQNEVKEMGGEGLIERILKETDYYIPYVYELGKSFFDGYLRKIEHGSKKQS